MKGGQHVLRKKRKQLAYVKRVEKKMAAMDGKWKPHDAKASECGRKRRAMPKGIQKPARQLARN